MSELAREMERQSGKESFMSGCTCPDCDETIREAKLIQTSLLPTHGFRNESIDIAFRFILFSDVADDFVDFFRLPDGLIGIYLEDMVGKSLSAAMFAALVMGTLRGIHKSGTDTARVPFLLNERLVQRPIRDRFCSTLYAFSTLSRGNSSSPNAGMPLPLSASGSACRQLDEGGLPSGMFPGSTCGRHVVQLVPADYVLFATDGLQELRNGEEVEFCSAHMEEAWAQCRHKSATESADFVFDRQVAFSDGRVPHDDTSVVVLKVLR